MTRILTGRVSSTYTDGESEIDFTAAYRVSPGCRATRTSPAEPDEVEFYDVRTKGLNGGYWPEKIRDRIAQRGELYERLCELVWERDVESNLPWED